MFTEKQVRLLLETQKKMICAELSYFGGHVIEKIQKAADMELVISAMKKQVTK